MTVFELAELLTAVPMQFGAPAAPAASSVRVGPPRPLDEAEAEQLTWLSQRELERRDSWRGSAACVVIAASGAATKYRNSRAVFIEVDSPKLAFIKAVDACFPELQTDSFEPGRALSIDPSSVVSSSARLASGVVVGPRVKVGERVRVGPNTVLSNCSIGDDSSVGANCTFGLSGFGYEKDESGAFHRFPHVGDVRIGRNVEIGSNTCIDRGSLGSTVIGDGCKIDNLVHIAHNVVLGRNVMVIANAMLGGSVRIDDGAWVAPSVAVMNQASIGADATLGLGAVVIKNVEAGDVVVGNPAKVLRSKKGDTP